MELRVLRYFLGVAASGSMTGAARVLHVTQPTLSRQLQELEEELGQKLFVRGSHSVDADFGRNAAPQTGGGDPRHGPQDGDGGSDRSEKTAAGEVHIGGGETEAMRQIARIIGELQQEHPRLRFHLYSGNAEDVTERLDKGLLGLRAADSAGGHHQVSLAPAAGSGRLGCAHAEELPAGRQNGGHPPGSGRSAVDLFAAGHAGGFPRKTPMPIGLAQSEAT